MLQKLNTICIFLFITSTASISLKCSSSRTKNSCQCNVKYDDLTSMALKEAKCQYLELQEFPSFSSDEVISVLDVSHNNLTELSTSDVSSRFGPSLFSLSVCHNSISHIDNDFFGSLPHLVHLDLSHNDLKSLEPKELFDKLEELLVLDLSYNEIEVLSDGIFSSLKNLKKINLSYNNLYQALQHPGALMVKLQLNQNLIHLSMDNVGVTRIHTKCWNDFHTLEYLSIADNPIDVVPQTSSTLEYLDISGTNITNIHENDLKYTSLRTLKMSRMANLTTVNPYAFFNLGNLENLVLTDSHKLSEISAVAFGALDLHTYPRRLRKFDVARNRLDTLDESFRFIFREMEEVDVSFNPWSCDCRLLWMKDTRQVMVQRDEVRCASPDDVTNKLALDLEAKDLPNCHPEIYGKKSHQTALLLLLMLVFVLIVVIVYLCMYSPSWSVKLGSSKMSPDSPYSINNEQI